jgi:hypothetical protein
VSAVLTIAGLQQAQIALAPDAFERREDILATTRSVVAVADAMDAEIAADALKLVTGLVKEVESARVEIGKPVLELTRQINAKAKDFTTELATEKTRLERILGDYQAAERTKADKLRREAQEEADRLARAAEKAALDADRATNSGDADRTQQVAAAAETKAIEARVNVATIAPTAPAGVAVRQNWKFEVTDIVALFKARPDLCVIEPNNAAIRAQIPYNQKIPGLRIWQEAKASVR